MPILAATLLPLSQCCSSSSSKLAVLCPSPSLTAPCSRVFRTSCLSPSSPTLQKQSPNVRKMSRREVKQVLPWTGSQEQLWQQISQPWGSAARLGVSLAASTLLYDVSTLAAAVAFLYWAWGPMWSAAVFSSSLRLRYPYAGVWHAKLLMVQEADPPASGGRRKTLHGSPETLNWCSMQSIFESEIRISRKLCIIIGDESQASFKMELSISSENARACKIGKRVNVLVLSDCPTISRFRAVREVYFPESGIWISEQPCISRNKFVYLS